MAQVRDAAFNPSSPHSSSAGADSYKHEGTPETRLTVFSPDDGSVRSNKIPTALGLNAPSDRSDHPAHFHHVNTIEGLGNPSAAAEKDPFVSSTTVAKGEQKLSPTASAFRPVSVPLKLERLGSACQGKRNAVSADGKVFLHLPNIRDARNAHDNVQLGSPDWRAEYIAAIDFYSAGSLMATGRFGQAPAGLQQYAMYPVGYPGLPAAGPSRFVLDQTPTRGQGVSHMAPMTPISGGMPIMAPLYNTTPPATPMAMHGDFTSPRTIQTYGRMDGRLDGRRQNAMRVNRSPFFNNAGHHNHVDVNRIRDGIDVRTTIMLRNIPNKVDQAMLKRIIDESSWGKYDFMYLRIDFANDCNVGYAFINFVDPLDIIDFVNARGNQRWNCFKSDKVAEISYATIQGKDCLVQKFRNSSVMLEAPHYRPKLYYTSNGPRPDLSGQEEPFPEPDNQSKMKRSCENAEHVGLFTPNAGQHFRDEQRRRRSQYDRGTRLAALEEYDYDAHVQAHSFFGPQ
ncbi:hypothetical protein NEMBOFW57_000993 [Staphylotrichum longicolle]|uniref:RRM domain-containing protein n=1 Tax=Staphylotrichum longicolle TaxID=669026 RepID=A0AAD4I1D1_9PEZI|nr:hypothetical protein NEMBOFW57_000993 [Staphylotrichum longicolle]